MSVGKAVLQIRRDKGMTQGDVAARSHLATSYISRIENNRIQPTMATLGRLAEALGVPVSDVFRIQERDGAGSKGGARPHACPVSSSGECIGELLRSDRGRPPEKKKAVYGKEELELLRMAEFVAAHGSKELRRSLSVVLEALVDQASRKAPRRRERRA